MSETLAVNSNISHYRIVSKIGGGGMGEVYLAEDAKLRRKLALKVLPQDIASDKDRLRRFEQEAFAASALNHPNILTIYEFGAENETHFLAAEFVEGETLRDKLRREPLALRNSFDIVLQIAAALSAAHGAGIVHRDIKPENVMLRDDGLVKVLDFGLAKLSEPEAVVTGSEDATKALVKTSPGMVMGTVAYMSPEQARGTEIDARSDVWSLGVVVYEMLAGRTPFAGETTNDTIAAILTREPAPLDENTPPELQRIIRKSLQKKADERYQTIKDFLLDVKNLKRELEFAEELERSQIPHSTKASNVSASQTGENATAILQAATQTQNSLPQQTSSAEYIVQEVKKHKLGVALGSLIPLALLGFGLWFFFLRASTVNAPIDSIAVLPFQNKNSDADTEYLSDGLAESLIFRLSQLPNLKVSPTSSVLRYKGKEIDVQKIGNELGVSAVITGRILQRGDNLNISVELVDVRNNKLIWGEQYERKLSELLATQREIAATITQKLQLKLSGGEKALTKKYTDNNEAYQLYLKGRFYFAKRTKDDILQSIELYRQAIKLDPNYALAFVGIAESFAVMPSFSYMSPKEAMPQAKAAVAKALEIDSELPEAHTVAGVIAATYDWNWTEAEREFKRSLELDPNLAITHFRYAWVYLSPMGRHTEAIAEMKRAMELEPLSLIQGANFAAVYMYARQFDLALEQARKTYDLDPNFVGGQNWLAHTYNAKGMYAESLLISEKSLLQSDSLMLAQAAYAYAKSGQRQKAEEVIKRWKEIEKNKYIMSYWVAVAYAALGEKDAAFAELEKSYQAHDWFLQRLRVDPFMDALRDDPRFADLVRRIGLPQ